MIKIILVMLLIFCFWGISTYLVCIRRINIFLTPAIIITAISGCMYIAGILNIMPIVVYLILGGGIYAAWKYRRHSKEIISIIRNNKLTSIMSIILLLYLIYFTYGGVYQDGDTMTHWGIIVREIFRNGRLPNFTNTIISYQSYPPATACWIYFIQKIGGYSEGIAIFAQGVWMIACAATMYSFCRKENLLSGLLITIFTIFSTRWMGGL